MKRSSRARIAIGFSLMCAIAGCTDAPKTPLVRYPSLPKKIVPDYLHDTILEYTDLSGIDPFPVSGYGLVANLNGTGGTRAPSAVREYIIKEMARHGFGSVVTGLASPEDLLANKSFAITRIDGFIPPGARAGTNWSTWFDVRVSALAESDTTSLAHGDLYQTELKVDGANPLQPGSGNVSVKAQAQGPIFINPSFALDDAKNTTQARSSRRNGVVLGGARALEDRPLILRLRSPERRIARAIERRVIEQFQDIVDDDLQGKGVAAAQDEGTIYVYVPKSYNNDWEHFAGVLKHLYMRGGAADFAALKAEQLAKEAVKKDAPLMDISYCWEGLGKPSLHAIIPLMNSADPAVQYAAARAAGYLGEPGAIPILISIARSESNPFRLNAVTALGQVPPSPMLDKMLRQLLSSDQALVRIEAYKILARHNDSSIDTRVVKRGEHEKFVLDLVQGEGKPMVYASRQGIPRLAIFGVQTELDLPLVFAAMNDRLTIASDVGRDDSLSIVYRGLEIKKPVTVASSPDLSEIARRLAGEGPAGHPSLDFSYADVVAILQAMVESQKVSGLCGESRQLASFVLQDLPQVQETIDTTPLIRETGRPQSDHSPQGATAPSGQLGSGNQSGAAERPPVQAGSGVSSVNEAVVK